MKIKSFFCTFQGELTRVKGIQNNKTNTHTKTSTVYYDLTSYYIDTTAMTIVKQCIIYINIIIECRCHLLKFLLLLLSIMRTSSTTFGFPEEEKKVTNKINKLLYIQNFSLLSLT